MLPRLYSVTAFVLFVGSAFADGPQKPAGDVEAANRKLPGLQQEGEILLPSQWSLRPAGKQVKLGDFPVNIALHPSGHWAAILHAGYGEHEVAVVDVRTQKMVSRVTVPQAFYGLCFDKNGDQLYTSGGEFEVVHVFHFKSGYLSDHREIKIGEVAEEYVPAGMTTSADGTRLFVANAWGDTVVAIPLAKPEKLEHIKFDKDAYPYAVLPTQDNKRLYVSLWGAARVAVVDLKKMRIEAQWATESHPTELVLSPDDSLLYVACANSNTVSVIETKTGRALEVISSALYANAPNGSTPNSISLTPDGKVLFIANADNNNLAVVDVSQRGQSRSLGYIPVGWYPTSVRFNAKDKKIYVANGKGLTSKSNRHGPNPLNRPPTSIREYIGGLMRGTLSAIESPSPGDMAEHTKQAYKCSPLRQDLAPTAKPRTKDNPIAAKLGDSSPIKHCIYIVKENRTYDQVFGDMPEGNGDPQLCIFGEKITPNHHALARQFVLLDNFYVESEVSADGHEWTMAAYATDFVEKSWPLLYRPGNKGKLSYPSEGSHEIAFPAGGYIWDRCREAGVSYRSYGEFIANGRTPEDPGRAKVKALEGHFDPMFRSYDLDYMDIKRADRFIAELKRFETEGEMPRFIVLRLPNDHTYGTRAGKRTPIAMVADNDLALGRVVEAVSNSKFWKDTAIFVIQDDAQNGSDHVDAHRTVALAVSPYTKRGHVDSTMYSTASMLRSMELILGLKPMSQFDAAARPMYASFQAKPDFKAYKHLPANVDLNATNSVSAWGAEMSEQLDFSREDIADDLLLNEIVWRSVRGPNSKMPAPVRASFVFRHPEDEDEDDDDHD